MKIQKITEKAFAPYGRVLEGYPVGPLLKVMEHMPLPEGEVIYEPSVEELEELPVARQFRDRAFGGMPIQIGYCNGQNKLLNALEYHRCSEVNIAVTDVIILLGRQQDIEEGYVYDIKKVEAFFVPAGTVIEVYATTLHYAPCMVSENGFRWGVILPYGTNMEAPQLPEVQGEDRLLAAGNKWLIAHEDAGIEGAFCGLKGENLSV